MYVDFKKMPEFSRVWVYQSTTPFTEEQSNHIHSVLFDFTQQWQSHGVNIPSSFAVLFNYFIVLKNRSLIFEY